MVSCHDIGTMTGPTASKESFLGIHGIREVKAIHEVKEFLGMQHIHDPQGIHIPWMSPAPVDNVESMDW